MPPDLVDQYLAFVRRYQTKSVADRIRQIEVRIGEIGNARIDALESIKRCRIDVVEGTKLVAQRERELAMLSDVGLYEEGLLRLMYEPTLLGIRVNSAGRLVLHLRAYRQEEGESRYVGDFEFNLDGLTGDYLTFVQTDVSIDRHLATQANHILDRREGVIQSILYETPRKYQRLLQEGNLCGLANALVERVSLAARSKYWLGLETAEPEPTWRGIAPEIERALERTLNFVVRSSARTALSDAAEALAVQKVSQKRATDRLRSYNTELTQKRAELERLQASAGNLEFDEEAVKQELRYMTSLPGVMGVRFEDVGTDGVVPVIHVRTTMVYYGRRYDLGDYELVLSKYHGERAAVVETRQTRQARSAGMYYHRSYGGRTWFCFGNRADELADLFEVGNFGAFLHFAINSLNSINESELSYYDLGSYFVEIDEDAVWVPRTATARRRPRRRWLTTATETL